MFLTKAKGAAMKRLFFALLLACHASAAFAQQYLMAGAGFSLMQFDSRDLDLFQGTYNAVNAGSGQNVFLRGFDLGIGLSAEVSYRRWSKWSQALTLGYQEMSATDIAAFTNGSQRVLKLHAEHVYLQPALGVTKKNIFVEGFLALFGARQFKLDSRLEGNDEANPLTGVYKAKVGFTADLGLGFGARSGPILLFARVSYPVRKAGRAKILTDPAPAKVATNLSAFPDDFVKFVNLESYKGVAGDIDGFKITMTLNFALRLSAREAALENCRGAGCN